MNPTMSIKDFSVTLHTPKALKGNDLHSLPPYAPRLAYKVCDYECPNEWMHGSEMAGSYFVSVEDGKGLWLDFQANRYHNHDVAVVVSIQGVNPITGPIKDGERCKFNLEQYRNKCPRHDIDFQQDQYCTKCGYKWPAQNYLASNSNEPMWIDGFRTESGEVRQYVLTTDQNRGVAAQMIGDERVWAIGCAFYKSKQPKPKSTFYIGPYKKYMIPPMDYEIYTAAPMLQPTYNMASNSRMASSSNCDVKMTSNVMRGMAAQDCNVGSVDVDNIEIAAGSRINQTIGVDFNDINHWEDKPAGFIYINYVSEQVANMILAKKRQHKNAFSNITVGN